MRAACLTQLHLGAPLLNFMLRFCSRRSVVVVEKSAALSTMYVPEQ
jgi:hypothetical protein